MGFFSRSHPSWVRGLKHKSRFIGGSDATSHPSWVRGLKLAVLEHSRSIFSRTPRGCVD